MSCNSLANFVKRSLISNQDNVKRLTLCRVQEVSLQLVIVVVKLLLGDLGVEHLGLNGRLVGVVVGLITVS